jgi:exosortase C (VPDSG-CTERM-specific)
MRDSSRASTEPTPREDFSIGSDHRPKTSGSSTRRLAYVGFILILGFAFIRPLADLFSYAARTDLHSHILLIPFISAYLLFTHRGRLPKEYFTSPRLALIPLCGGLVTLISARFLLNADPPISQNDYLSLSIFSFGCFLATGGFSFLGRDWMAGASFPFAFLLFMAPLPDRALHFLETASQLASTEVAAIFFAIAQTPMLREGAVFHLPGIAIEVAQECSGIRSSWVLFITTVAASFLFLQSPWRRAFLIAFVIPLAILRNGFRIWVIGLLCVELGPQMIDSPIHHYGGPLFFALSLVPLSLLLWSLRLSEIAAANRLSETNDPGPKQENLSVGLISNE